MAEKLATRRVDLTDGELALLDGRCRAEVQTVVDIALSALAIAGAGLSDRDAAFVADVIAEAKENGRLVYRPKSIRYCKICHRSAPSITHGRNGRRLREPKSGLLAGVELAVRFVVMQGYATLGGCHECVARLTPDLRERLVSVPAEMPEALMGHAPRWKREDNRHCTACDWRGHEGEMGRRRTLFNDGTYPAICPKCNAENAPLSRTVIESAPGFAVVAVQS